MSEAAVALTERIDWEKVMVLYLLLFRTFSLAKF